MQLLRSNSCFLATQETRSLHITFTFFLPWIMFSILNMNNQNRIRRVRVLLCFRFFFKLCVFCSSSLWQHFEKVAAEGVHRKSALKIFTKLTGKKYLCWSRPETLLRKRLWHMYFRVIFTKVFQNTFFIEHFRAPALSLLLESPVFLVFLSSNLPDVYLLVFCFPLHMFLFYLLSDNDCTNSFDSYKVFTLCLFIE